MPEHIGGTELYARTLSIRQLHSGHEVAIFVPAEISPAWPEPAKEDGVRIYRFPTGARSAIKSLRNTFGNRSLNHAFDLVLAKEQPDIIHIQHLMGLPVSLVDLLIRRRIPYVLTLHDYWYICANAQLLTNYDNTICDGPNWWLNCARCAFARMDLRNVDILSPAIAPIFALRNRKVIRALSGAQHVIAPTSFVRDTYGNLGLNIERITVVPHGIDTPSESYSRREPVENELSVAYIGGLSWQKGVHVLIAAFNDLPMEGSLLAIWGDQKAFPDYVKELLELAQHQGIEFNGQLSRERLWSVLAGYDVVVVPSLWYETASLIIQEAFAVGVPVIASGIGALKSRVIDGVDGLLVPPNDPTALAAALSKLRNNPDLLRRLQSGIQAVYTIPEHASEIEDLYESVIGR
jgi:glycosyltransferase involved in cell wall biosynthesis